MSPSTYVTQPSSELTSQQLCRHIHHLAAPDATIWISLKTFSIIRYRSVITVQNNNDIVIVKTVIQRGPPVPLSHRPHSPKAPLSKMLESC